jgi:hypothetical protein
MNSRRLMGSPGAEDRASCGLNYHTGGADGRSGTGPADVRVGSCVTSIAGPNGMRNCTRDEGGPFGFGDQEPIPSHRKLLLSKATVVNVAETSGR